MKKTAKNDLSRIKSRNEKLIESITKIINSGDRRFLQKIEILIEDFEELEKLKLEFQALDNELEIFKEKLSQRKNKAKSQIFYLSDYKS